MEKIYSVAVIGGGVSGAVTALQLSDLGVDNILFEKGKSLVNGPPFCHLHAGGNLYPDISEEHCKLLMRQSIEMARLFPQSIDKRPTFISIQKSEDYEAENITDRLEILVEYYKNLIAEDPANEVLGAPANYYNIYNKEQLIHLSQQSVVQIPNTPDQWITNAIKLIDLEQLKMPVILVQEYGWNFFRLAAQAQLALTRTSECTVKLNTEIVTVKNVSYKNLDYNWEVKTNNEVFKVKYLVNSCGYKTGEFDEPLKLNSEHLIEFKASYLSKWQPIQGLIPELIFHGKRGTNNGMAQLTPYCDDYFQIHGMTKDITLFKNGLIKLKNDTHQTQFNNDLKQKLAFGWKQDDINTRTKSAIRFVTKFVPSFKSAIVGGPPLYGAQQIPGNDPDLRVGEVSFPTKFYARSEIVKASSALTVANQIIDKIQEEKIIPTIKKQSKNTLLKSIKTSEIDTLASELAIERGYPKVLAKLVIEK